jgi:uncharacterized protein with PQ loop repeat
MVNWNIFGYIGIIFAMIYRIPQIIKIYKNKRCEDISTKTFILHNCAYIFLLIYISNKSPTDYLILSYYIIGIIQNLIIVLMKRYYKNSDETVI